MPFAIFSAAAATLFIKYWWFSPQLQSGKNYLATYLINLLTAFVLSFLFEYLGVNSLSEAFQTGFWSWLGFMVPVSLAHTQSGHKSWKFFVFHASYHFASLVTSSLVLFYLL